MRQIHLLVPFALLCCGPLIAQDRPEMAMARRVLGPTREAGIYHVGTGTWTRGSNAWANLGPDVIFNADTGAGYFAAFPADSIVGEEEGETSRGGSRRWLVDPLDGTLNYANGFLDYCVSSVLEGEGKV